jgi:histidinol phosphatase-like enzyme
VCIDLDTVLLARHREARGSALSVQADIREGLERLAQIADRIVVLVYPGEQLGRRPEAERLQLLNERLDGSMDEIVAVSCPHDGNGCDCAKPGSGLIELARRDHGLARHGGWFIGADQEGVQSGRGAGLQTIRIGPEAHDHMSVVHRPDYEARDLLDAANYILIQELS